MGGNLLKSWEIKNLYFPYNSSVSDKEGLSSCVLKCEDISGAPFQLTVDIENLRLFITTVNPSLY